jgi:hypothetical protein
MGRRFLCERRGVNIDVRPTPALRRHRARIAGALVGVGLLVATAWSVAELASAADGGSQQVPVSESTQP